MTHNLDFSVWRLDLRDWFIQVLITIVMLALAVDGWLAYIR